MTFVINFLNGAGGGICLGLLAVRKLSFVLFLSREIVTHYSFLTGTAFRFANSSLQPTQNPPNPTMPNLHKCVYMKQRLYLILRSGVLKSD